MTMMSVAPKIQKKMNRVAPATDHSIIQQRNNIYRPYTMSTIARLQSHLRNIFGYTLALSSSWAFLGTLSGICSSEVGAKKKLTASTWVISAVNKKYMMTTRQERNKQVQAHLLWKRVTQRIQQQIKQRSPNIAQWASRRSSTSEDPTHWPRMAKCSRRRLTLRFTQSWTSTSGLSSILPKNPWSSNDMACTKTGRWKSMTRWSLRRCPNSCEKLIVSRRRPSFSFNWRSESFRRAKKFMSKMLRLSNWHKKLMKSSSWIPIRRIYR